LSHFTWTKGGEADIVSVDGERIVISSTISSPPGSYLDGVLNGAGGIRIKVRGCKRDGERFRIEARILDLSRQLREHISQVLIR
jgi:hypothetical protein